MTNELPYTKLSKLYEPVQKLIDLNLQKFQAAISAQSDATKTFIDQADERIKAATEIKDFDALSAFIKEQSEIARANMEKMIAESKAATDEVVAYGKEVQKILNEGLSSITPQSEPAPKKTTKKAAE